MSSMIEKKVEQFAQELIELHGFRRNNGFSCVVPDTNKFPNNEGVFLWGFSQTRKRFETKIEKFHTDTRIRRMEKMIGVPAKEYVKILPAIKSYLDSLKALGFEPIGKGVKMFEGEEKVFNVQANASVFENNLENLKKFEKLTLNNPIIKFVEKHGYFKVDNKDKLAWDSIFGNIKNSKKAKPAATKKSVAKPVAKKTTKAPAAKVPAAKKSAAKSTATKTPVAKKPAAKSTATKTPVAKKSATTKTPTKNRPKNTSKTTSSQTRNTWVNQIGAMYKRMQSWLSKPSFVFNTVTNRLDDNLGSYDVETLEISMGEHQIILKPVETDVFGAVGRIDVISGNNKTMLLLFSKTKSYQWEIWNSPDDRQTLNKSNVDKLLAKWFES
ncbi:hypothetical protein QUF74_06625 [Candidatus Halobeggiatoa sp. HSG11]|nr:hypothetical protein [Candidatus Halobeggiatoa sp. HSG11]